MRKDMTVFYNDKIIDVYILFYGKICLITY